MVLYNVPLSFTTNTTMISRDELVPWQIEKISFWQGKTFGSGRVSWNQVDAKNICYGWRKSKVIPVHDKLSSGWWRWRLQKRLQLFEFHFVHIYMIHCGCERNNKSQGSRKWFITLREVREDVSVHQISTAILSCVQDTHTHTTVLRRLGRLQRINLLGNSFERHNFVAA